MGKTINCSPLKCKLWSTHTHKWGFAITLSISIHIRQRHFKYKWNMEQTQDRPGASPAPRHLHVLLGAAAVKTRIPVGACGPRSRSSRRITASASVLRAHFLPSLLLKKKKKDGNLI